MVAILETLFSNAISLMKMIEFQLKYHWTLFRMISLTMGRHCFRQWLGTEQTAGHYLNK